MSSSELTTSRINRLLRPLRVNCAQLAAHAASSAGSSSGGFATYSKTQAWRPSEKGPLALVLPPNVLQARAPAHIGGVRNAELARKIYALHSAFRNVVQAAFGDVYGREPGTSRIQSLVSICATVVGENIQEEVDINIEPGVEAVEEEAKMGIVNEMYDLVPPRYRRWTLAAHALSTILDSSPHDPTLLSLILETAVLYGLLRESRTVLRALLRIAIPPGPLTSEPLCHPAHISYLSDLLIKWTTSPVASQHIEPLVPFSASVFVAELVEAVDERGTPALLMGKAIRELMRELRLRDFSSFVLLTSCLYRQRKLHGHHSKSGDGLSDTHKELTEHLVLWIGLMMGHLNGDGDWCDGEVQEEARQHRSVLVNFLSDIHSEQTQIGERPLNDDGKLTSSVLSLACLCLGPPGISNMESMPLVAFLRETPSSPTSFDPLVRLLFPAKSGTGASSALATASSTSSQEGQAGTLGSSLHILRSLRTLARVLRAHGLRRHEAALWSTALRVLETEWMTTRALATRGAAVVELRSELVRRAEAAERARRRRVTSAKENARSAGRLAPYASPAIGDGWVWEEFAGCWMQKTPARPEARARLNALSAVSNSDIFGHVKPQSGGTFMEHRTVPTHNAHAVKEIEEDDFCMAPAHDSPLSSRTLVHSGSGKPLVQHALRSRVLSDFNDQLHSSSRSFSPTSSSRGGPGKRKSEPTYHAPSLSPIKKRARFADAPSLPNARRWSAHTPRAYKVLGMSPARAAKSSLVVNRRSSAPAPRVSTLFAPAPAADNDDVSLSYHKKRRWSAHTPRAKATSLVWDDDDDVNDNSSDSPSHGPTSSPPVRPKLRVSY